MVFGSAPNRIMFPMGCLILPKHLPIRLNTKANWKNAPNNWPCSKTANRPKKTLPIHVNNLFIFIESIVRHTQSSECTHYPHCSFTACEGFFSFFGCPIVPHSFDIISFVLLFFFFSFKIHVHVVLYANWWLLPFFWHFANLAFCLFERLNRAHPPYAFLPLSPLHFVQLHFKFVALDSVRAIAAG